MLDHIVFGGPDLGAAVQQFESLTGVAPVAGGRHPGRGTANYLVGLGGSAYLEIVGPDPDQPEHEGARPFGVADLTQTGILTWAARTRDLDRRIAAARAAGYDPGPPSRMSRATRSGELLRWRLTESTGDPLVPFLIDWGESAHPSEQGLPVVSLITFEATHPAPDATCAALDALGVDLRVRIGSRVGLSIVLAGRYGAVVLT